MSHTHEGTRLTFGCPACIAQVEQDQRRAGYADMDDDTLYDLWAECGVPDEDDEFVGLILVERSVLTMDEMRAACPVVVAT